ncbi:MAG TPA: PAS domain-containing protein [Vicinamibacteria bacterium]|nr:PAS domain-containing protein [Vicinamibacteria bacterium]
MPKSLEAQLRATLNMIPAYTWYAARSGGLTFVNERAADYGGLPSDHPLRYGTDSSAAWDSHMPFLHPEDQEETRRVWSECLRTGRPGEMSFRVRNAEGNYRWFLSRAEPLRSTDGTILYWIGINLDIDERKQVEVELRRSKEYLADAQRLSGTGSVGMDVSTKRIFWSEEAARIYGYPPGTEPTPDLILQRSHPDDVGRLKEVLERAAQGGNDFDWEHRLLMPDGSIKHLHDLGHCFRDEAGNEEIIGAITDITERKVAEEAIRRSEAYLAEAQRLSQTGSFGWKPDTGEIVWSDETYRIFEYDRAEKPDLDIVLERIHPQDEALAQQIVESVSTRGSDLEHECRLLMPGGAIKHLHVRAHALHDSSGNIEFVGAVTDITARKRAEERLRQSEERFRLVLNSIDAQVIATTVEGELEFVNQQVLDYFGKTLEQLKGWRTGDVLHPDDLASAIAISRASIEQGVSYDVDHRFRRSDGVHRWFHVCGRPQRDEHGSIVRWYALHTDIDERKKAEQRLEEQEMELRQILDLAPQLVGVLGPQAERLYANRVTLSYFGVTLDQWRQTDRRSEVHPDDVDRIKAHIDRSLTTGAAGELELRLRAGDGTYRWFLVRSNPLCDDRGQLVRWYIAYTDIEDRKRAEERLLQENVALREEIDKTSMFEEIVGTSPALTAVLSRVSKVASSDSTVLISGDTGTGKELVARAIHRRSRRGSRAFVAVNCAAIPRDLIASELFGHEKGAFTGAIQRRLGRFELANGGTIFLDEVGELSSDTQVALLRVLQEHEFERLGGRERIQVDARVIAATNRDLTAAVADGTFRQDLFYRLNVFPLEMPPLRERQEDIPVLVEYFISRYARKAGKTFRRVSKRTLDRLQSYRWPGNVRELQNVIERSVIVSDTDEFTVDESWLSEAPPVDSRLGLSGALAAHEKAIVEDALRASGGRVFGPLGAAARLGIPRSTLEWKIRALKINKSRFRVRAPKRS